MNTEILEDISNAILIENNLNKKNLDLESTRPIKIESSKKLLSKKVIVALTIDKTFTKIDGNRSNIRITRPIENDYIKMYRSNIYILPITDETLDYSLPSSHAIKIERDFRLYFEILDVYNGFVTIKPNFDEIKITNGTCIGEII